MQKFNKNTQKNGYSKCKQVSEAKFLKFHFTKRVILISNNYFLLISKLKPCLPKITHVTKLKTLARCYHRGGGEGREGIKYKGGREGS